MVFTTTQVMEINDIPDATTDMQEPTMTADLLLHMDDITIIMTDMTMIDTMEDLTTMRTE